MIRTLNIIKRNNKLIKLSKNTSQAITKEDKSPNIATLDFSTKKKDCWQGNGAVMKIQREWRKGYELSLLGRCTH